MGEYETNAIKILRAAFGERFDRKRDVVYSFGPEAGTGEVDGTLDGRIAIEIGDGSPKQIRASLLDLMFHPYRGKLLILVDSPGHSSERSVIQAATILARAGCAGVVYRLSQHKDARLIADDLAFAVSKYIEEIGKKVNRVLAVAELGMPSLVFDCDDLLGTDPL